MAGIWIETITIAARNPAALARFWIAMLDYECLPNHTDSVQIGAPDSRGPVLLFAPAQVEGFGRDRFHLDLRPADQQRSVDDALTWGATALPTPQEASWKRMADPEGNRFCLLQSDADAREFTRLHGVGSPSI